jgi:hypothetical protein
VSVAFIVETPQRLPDARNWELWTEGGPVAEITGLKPRLASWNRSDHPDQIRLREYLRDLSVELGPLTAMQPLFLMWKNRDVWSVITISTTISPGRRSLGSAPVPVRRSGQAVGGGSDLRIGLAVPLLSAAISAECEHFSCAAGAGAQEKRWKEGVRSALMQAGAQQLPAGLVEARVAWRCSARRNWVWLWKPTIDAMGPILGQADPRNPYHPNDDRIVRLCLHVFYDETIAHAVDVAMWWRSLGTAADARRSQLNTEVGRSTQ